MAESDDFDPLEPTEAEWKAMRLAKAEADVKEGLPGGLLSLYDEVLRTLRAGEPVDDQTVLLLLEKLGPPRKKNDKSHQEDLDKRKLLRFIKVIQVLGPVVAGEQKDWSLDKAVEKAQEALRALPREELNQIERGFAYKDPANALWNVKDWLKSQK